MGASPLKFHAIVLSHHYGRLVHSGAEFLPRNGRRFSLSPGERAGVRASVSRISLYNRTSFETVSAARPYASASATEFLKTL